MEGNERMQQNGLSEIELRLGKKRESETPHSGSSKKCESASSGVVVCVVFVCERGRRLRIKKYSGGEKEGRRKNICSGAGPKYQDKVIQSVGHESFQPKLFVKWS